MGNHFRTPGDEQPVPNAPAPGASVPAQPLANPNSNMDLLDDAVPTPGPGMQPPAAQIPDPLAPVSRADVFMAPGDPGFDPATFRTRDGSAAPSTDADEHRQVADLDAALASPDFTTVFAPVGADCGPSMRDTARQAGVEPVILMEHLTKVYPAQPNKAALDDINLEIYPGEFVFLVGHSGSGKTTLLNTILRNVKPTSGRVMVAGQDLMRIKNRRIPFLRRQIGAVFQDYKLLPNKTAFENVAASSAPRFPRCSASWASASR